MLITVKAIWSILKERESEESNHARDKKKLDFCLCVSSDLGFVIAKNDEFSRDFPTFFEKIFLKMNNMTSG